jgi:cell division protein FtsI/penicillin-binding protein 2
VDKFSDNLSSLPPGTVVKPTTVAALLHKLQLSDAPQERQAKAIRTWLNSNKPSDMMLYSLRNSKFAGLLDRRSA